MRKLSLALVSLFIPAVAEAGLTVDGNAVQNQQGITMQGITMQGITMQGITMQGITMQGITMQGITMQGITMQGITMQGTSMSGSIIDTSPSSCSHSQTVTGAALPAGCNKCVEIVANRDSYCSDNYWDSICVNEARSWCAFTQSNLIGATFTANVAGGGTRTLRLDAVTQVPDPTPYWETVCDVDADGYMTDCWYENQSDNENADVLAYSFSMYKEATTYHLECEDGYGCWYVYDGNGEPASWEPLCDSTDLDGLYNQAIPVPGTWNDCVGPGCGGPVGGVGQTFTLACRDRGVLAKCIERFQYKPWKDTFSTLQMPLLASCVRMARADYCGDGSSHTYDGTWIDAYDSIGVQQSTTTWGHEATWNPNGAACIIKARYAGQDPGNLNRTIYDYIQTSCPDRMNQVNHSTGQYLCGMNAETSEVFTPTLQASCGSVPSDPYLVKDSGDNCWGTGHYSNRPGNVGWHTVLRGIIGNRSNALPR